MLDLRAAVPVSPRCVPGVGRWLMVQCPKGHVLRSVPWGEWAQARKVFERPGAELLCVRCAGKGSA